MNPAQIACIELRKAAYLTLDHCDFLELLGSRPSSNRHQHYKACRNLLPPETLSFWDAKPAGIASGIASAGKFERYFEKFRKLVLPLAHPRSRVLSLLEKRNSDDRSDFYRDHWNNRRWNWIFTVFFSRKVMGALGRDPEFFKYVEGSVAERILSRTRHALEHLDPSENPYLHWILTGTHGTALPEALEENNYEAIRKALAAGHLNIVNSPLEDLLERSGSPAYDAFNLSDIFEYMSEENTAALLGKIHSASNPGARLAYWNMLAPRSRPDSMSHLLKPLTAQADELFQQDRAFFYSRFVIEEVLA
jgi:S-adenosylmethionine-diacylglycerol 3-amino-3-carboxypropyl transferase